jgi:hypothetical protein
MYVFADLEGHRFSPGNMAPPIVCLQWCADDGPAFLMTKRGEFSDGRTFWNEGPSFAWRVADWINGGATIVGHSFAYDMACLCAWDAALTPLIFAAYRRNQITDTMYRQKLADIGRGKHRGFQAPGGWVQFNYDLGAVGSRHGYRVNKEDPWRLYYALLDEIPLDQWHRFSAWVPVLKKDVPQVNADGTPQMVQLFGGEAITYALGDPIATRAAYCGQAERYHPDLFVDEYQQARKFWSLRLASVWGLRTSLRGVLSLEKGAREERDHLAGMLLDAKFKDPWGQEWPEPLVRAKVRCRPEDLSRDTEAAKRRMVRACQESGVTLRMTKGNNICLDSDACQSSGDPLLEAYAGYSSMSKVLSNDVEMLRKGVWLPIHTHFDLVDTGRVSSAKPNVMNPRRLTGVRECYVPRGYRE